MAFLSSDDLSPAVREVIYPFVHDILENSAPQIHSIYLVGSVLTGDEPVKTTNIDSVVVLKKIDLAFLEVLAPLGNKYGKKGLASPLIMDPGYIHSSVDVFPLEFLNFKLRHRTLYGEDLLAGLEIDRRELRYQCERELKGKIIWLHKIYVSAMGDPKVLAKDIVRHFDGYPALLRGILYLLGEAPKGDLKSVLKQLNRATDTDISVFAGIDAIRKDLAQPSGEGISRLFKNFYLATARLAEVVDGIQIT